MTSPRNDPIKSTCATRGTGRAPACHVYTVDGAGVGVRVPEVEHVTLSEGVAERVGDSEPFLDFEDDTDFVSEGEGVRVVAESEPVGEADTEAVGVTEIEPEVLGVGDADALGDSVMDIDGDEVGVWDGDAVAEALGVGVGVALGVGVGVALGLGVLVSD